MLRRPPLGHVLASAHDMAREHKIIAAVGKTSVPVPPALGLCDDDRRQRGAVLRDGLRRRRRARQPGEGPRRSTRRCAPQASEHLIDVLADLHAVDIDAIGLGDLARRGGYIERQLKRWKHAVGGLQDPRAAGHRRGRPAPRRADPRAAGRRHRPRRLPLRQLPHRHRGRAHRRRPRLGAVHARRPAGRRRLPARVLGRPRPGGPPQRPDERRRLPDLRRPPRALRQPHRARPQRHRLLRGVLVVAPGRHLRGRVLPLPARGDGRPGPRARPTSTA